MRVRRRGFVLIALCASMALMLAFLGLAFDLGRIYIARNEAQIFTDAAAMAAAAQLDGSAGSIEAARAAAGRLANRWNLSTRTFSDVALDFSADGLRWEAEPETETSMRFARVTVPNNGLDILFLRAVGGPETLTVPARSVAAADPVRLVQ